MNKQISMDDEHGTLRLHPLYNNFHWYVGRAKRSVPAKQLLYSLIFLFAFIFLFTSCTHVSRKDGPPNFYVDETRIPNAVPKPEPLSKYGNMRSYVVFGKRYYVMRSSKHYDQIGTASWYGSKFHARHTSNGERYNMLSMTAAHKTLPLPTYVQVTNLRNHRTIIVKVNDRGPFASNRIIDLSYVAAKKLGMLGHGTTQVRVTAIDSHYNMRPVVFAKNRHPQSIYLRVGAFRNRNYAENLRQRLDGMLEAPVTIHRPANLYHVQVGPIKDVAATDRIRSQLKEMGIKSNKIT